MGLLVINTFSLCMSEKKNLYFAFVVVIYFIRFGIIAWQYFSLSTLKCCFLICIVSSEKSVVILTFVSQYEACLFVLDAFKHFNCFENVILLCLGVLFFTSLVFGICWGSWICGFIVFIKLWKNFGRNFKYFFLYLLSFLFSGDSNYVFIIIHIRRLLEIDL